MKKLACLISVLAVVALCGCLKVEQEITLNKDGSGRVEMMYAMPEQTISQLKAMAEMAKQSLPEGEETPEEEDQFEFDETKIKEKFAAWKDKGITLKSAKTEEKEGWKYAYVVFDFKDISKLKETKVFENLTIVKNDEGNYVLTQPVGEGMEGMGMGGAEETGPEAEQMNEMMMAMLKGMRVVMKINTPTKIIDTTAPEKTKTSATWIIDVDKDPGSLKKVGGKDMEIIFSGKGCTIPEVK